MSKERLMFSGFRGAAKRRVHALGILIGFSEGAQLVSTNWPVAILEAVDETRDDAAARLEVLKAVETVVGLGTCSAAEALDILAKRSMK